MQQREMLFDAPALPTQGSAPSDALVGLDLVRQAIERLGAQFDWTQLDPADAALLVRLPLAEAAAAAAPAGMTLLCIEDNPVNLMLVQELVAMRPGIRLLQCRRWCLGAGDGRQTTGPTWCCWTCTCPTSMVGRSPPGCARIRALPPAA